MSKRIEITPLRDVKKAAILSAVAKLKDISLAAAALGLGKTTLCRKLKEYGVALKITPRVFDKAENERLAKRSRRIPDDSNALALLIDQQLRESPGLSLVKLEGVLKIGRHRIEKAVRSTAGKTFRQLRNRVMLEEATKLLRDQPELSVKEVACKLGYSSQSTLSRFLKANSGQSSTKIRLSTNTPKRHSRNLSSQ